MLLLQDIKRDGGCFNAWFSPSCRALNLSALGADVYRLFSPPSWLECVWDFYETQRDMLCLWRHMFPHHNILAWLMWLHNGSMGGYLPDELNNFCARVTQQHMKKKKILSVQPLLPTQPIKGSRLFKGNLYILLSLDALNAVQFYVF